MPLASLFRSLSMGENGRLLLYLMAAQAAVQISSPYFNPFMLGQLHFSYTIYAIVICTATVAKIYFLPTVGRIADRVGVRRVFWTSAAASVFVPAFWLASNNWIYLVGVQIYSGMAWCAFDLATLLLFIETIRGRNGSTFWPSSTWRTRRRWRAARFGAGVLAALRRPRRVSGAICDFDGRAGLAIVLLIRWPARSVVREIGRVPAPHFITQSLLRHNAHPSNHGESRNRRRACDCNSITPSPLAALR